MAQIAIRVLFRAVILERAYAFGQTLDLMSSEVQNLKKQNKHYTDFAKR